MACYVTVRYGSTRMDQCYGFLRYVTLCEGGKQASDFYILSDSTMNEYQLPRTVIQNGNDGCDSVTWSPIY